MTESFIPPRPPTPQVLLHRLPDKPTETTRKPSKYIILILGSTATAGKVQIARSVAAALSCPLYQGDSLHDSSAKASSVGTSRIPPSGVTIAETTAAGPNEARYRRMWLSKMTRTGLLFPEESRPATEGFSGFGGTSSVISTSRRGSESSIASEFSNEGTSSSSDTSSRDQYMSPSSPPLPVTSTFLPDGPAPCVNTVFTLSEEERRRRLNPALMVLTHPELERWHKSAIRTAVGDYGIGVIFVPLQKGEEDEENYLPCLRPLDPKTMSTFPASIGHDAKSNGESGGMGREMTISVDSNDDVESKTLGIIEAVKDVMGMEK